MSLFNFSELEGRIQRAIEGAGAVPEIVLHGWHDAATDRDVGLRCVIEFPDLAVRPGRPKGMPVVEIAENNAAVGRGPRPFRAKELQAAVTCENALHAGPRWRPRVAVVVDEEEDYACLVAYCLHRENYRVMVCTSLAELKAANALAKEETPSLIVQDIQLHFEDSDEPTWEDLKKREEVLRDLFGKALPAPPKILIISTAPDRSGINREYLDRLSRKSRHAIKQKPLAGIHALRVWLRSEMGGPAPQGGATAYRPGHSASGRAQVSALSLIARARWLREHGVTTCDWLRGAFVATQALEILNGQTPTLALEALSLRHQFEALAECRFFGISYDYDARSRIDELTQEVEKIASVYLEKHRPKWEALANVLNDLVIIYRNEGQFEAEAACLARLRKARVCAGRPWCLQIFLRYVNALVSSGLILTMMIEVNVVLLWLGFRAVISTQSGTPWLDSEIQAILCFFTVQPPPVLGEGHFHPREELAVSIAGIVSGYLHLGVLISYLYARFSRR